MSSQDGYSTSRAHYPPFGGREVDADGTLYDVVEWRKTFEPDLHHRIHQGEAFMTHHNSSILAGGATINIHFVTAETSPPHIIFDVSGKFDFDFDILEGVTVTGGTSAPSYNKLRSSTKVSGSTIKTDVTITDEGTNISANTISEGQKYGGAVSEFAEIILKPSTEYVFRFTSRANSNRAHINLTWYEIGI